MIDRCIFEVYNRDKKVFIPEFGAIIYSEYNDQIDFNDLLTFDDGKVVEEIQKQGSVSEEEARNALEDYVQMLKSEVAPGKSHYLHGIGYITENEQGNIIIQQTKTGLDDSSSDTDVTPMQMPFNSGKTSEEKEISDFENESKAAEDAGDEVQKDRSIEIDESYGISEAEKADDSMFNQDAYNEQNDADETIFDVEDEEAFNFEGEVEIEEEKTRQNNGLKIAFLVIVPILLIAAAIYYFLISNPDKEGSENSVSTPISQTSEPIPADNNEIAETAEPGNVSEEQVKEEIRSEASLYDAVEEAKTFCLVLGSFKVERNADRYLYRLKQRGIEATKFSGRKNFFFVGIKDIDGKTRAVQKLTEVQKSVPSAWIYNKALLL
jgi:cell division septation protein DedD